MEDIKQLTKEKLQYYTQMIDDKQVNTDLLISCLANLELRISKAAYLRAKFINSGMMLNEGHEYEMKQYMKYRTEITNLLVSIYSKQDIKVMVDGTDKNDIVTNKLCDTVIELVESKDFQLL